MKKENYFVKVETLKGEKLVFQLPGDLKSAMSDFEKEGNSLSDYFKGSLITIPLTKYPKKKQDPDVILGMAKVVGFFKAQKNLYWRTRGQFIVLENYKNCSVFKSSKYSNFLKHDHSKINQARILKDYYKWLKKEVLEGNK